MSSRTGEGLDDLRERLVELVASLATPDPEADVRLWVDRRFTISGAGTVVTGTLTAGTIATGDALAAVSGSASAAGSGWDAVRVRGIQSLGRSVASVSGVARVALNLTGDLDHLDRASILTTPGSHRLTEVVDVRVAGGEAGETPDLSGLPALPVLHIGALALTARVRPLDADLVRLTLEHPLPLRVGDRAVLRDPGSRQVWGVRVLDPLPPALRRRGAAVARAETLASVTGRPDLASELDRREVLDLTTLRHLGVPAGEESSAAGSAPVVRVGHWLMSGDRAARVARQVAEEVEGHDRAHPLDRGLSLAVLAERTGLPSPDLVAAVVAPPLRLVGGKVRASEADALPPELEKPLAALADDLAEAPFAAPTADRLGELGLDARRVAAAAKAGRLLRLAPGIVLLPGSDLLAAEWLAELAQPFTASEARTRLSTSRRVVLPLLEHLDRTGLTRRWPDDRREVLED